jgi:hypothetical protein
VRSSKPYFWGDFLGQKNGGVASSFSAGAATCVSASRARVVCASPARVCVTRSPICPCVCVTRPPNLLAQRRDVILERGVEKRQCCRGAGKLYHESLHPSPVFCDERLPNVAPFHVLKSQTHVCVRVCVCVYVCLYIYTYICTPTHPHTHTHTYTYIYADSGDVHSIHIAIPRKQL